VNFLVKLSQYTSHNTAVNKDDIQVYCGAKQYKQQLLSAIQGARSRIYITALYLQDDAAGREVLEALYQAKIKNPQLVVKVFVDAHRAQRGLIGENNQMGNRGIYLDFAKKYQVHIDIYGVAVKRKELFGVLHLKGMVFDHSLFYTGASINDIYLHQEQRYRLDRYYQIQSGSLSNSFCTFLEQNFVQSGLAIRLNSHILPSPSTQQKNVKRLKSRLKKASYSINSTRANIEQQKQAGDISINALLGYGGRGNRLNKSIRQLVQNCHTSLLLFTPYFNLPNPLSKDVIKAMKRGVKVTIIVADKTANDFYIEDQNEFNTIGGVPYLYEILLKQFVKKWQSFIDNGTLDIKLWCHEKNSFHLKGLVADERYHLLTGSNINPRAWTLDLENGLLLDDRHGALLPALAQELTMINQHTRSLKHYDELESRADYPDKPRKLLQKIRVTQIDRILKRLL
jgi:CDP-diacylglycerol--serine O-phosphatidyltransferase